MDKIHRIDKIFLSIYVQILLILSILSKSYKSCLFIVNRE